MAEYEYGPPAGAWEGRECECGRTHYPGTKAWTKHIAEGRIGTPHTRAGQVRREDALATRERMARTDRWLAARRTFGDTVPGIIWFRRVA